MKADKKTVKHCKNCTITEVWVQITGMPGERREDPANPYPLFNNLKQSLQKNQYKLQGKILPKSNPTLFDIQTGSHKVSISPPFWNGEISWIENNQKKVIRVGHRFFALHTLFNKNSPYINYENSFQNTLKKIINYIEDLNIFEVIQITVRYINTIEVNQIQGGTFDIGKYFNISVSSHLSKSFLSTNFNFEFTSSNKRNRIIGINTNIRGGDPRTRSIINTIQTTGVNPLEKRIRLNDEHIFDEIQSIREELKEVFFDTMTENTKSNIMEVKYA